jgi:hypothetical protein
LSQSLCHMWQLRRFAAGFASFGSIYGAVVTEFRGYYRSFHRPRGAR